MEHKTSSPLKVVCVLVVALLGICHGYTPDPQWLETAQSLIPTLTRTAQEPLTVVNPVQNNSTYLRWDMVPSMTMKQLYNTTFNAGDSFILDFGGHRTGFFSFYLFGVGYPDAPCHLQLTFGEVPGDVAEDFYPYYGTISEAWLPTETIHVDYLPEQVNMPRRYAFRYVKVEILATSVSYSAQFANFTATAVTSGTNPVPPPSLQSPYNEIDAVGVATLRDVMQTSFEDGARRDRRLWIGDLRVMGLANHVTFQNYNLFKRCLYLFASFPTQDGYVAMCAYEYPTPHAFPLVLLDYSAIYVTALYEYANMTGDLATAKELFIVAQAQIELFQSQQINEDYIVTGGGFIDWASNLDKAAAMQGVMIWAMRRFIMLGELTGNDVSNITTLVERMTQAAIKTYWDESLGLFTSKGQVSWASQAWLVLADVVNSTEAASIFTNLLKQQDAVLPTTPYLYHYTVEAMIHVGFNQAALQIIQDYWGGMVERGADTFWELYNPTNSSFSPYGSVYANSFCHGWSSTVSYFLRSFFSS